MLKNTKRKQQKKKKNNKRKQHRKMKQRNSDRLQLGDHEVKRTACYQLGRYHALVFEILSRLTVKSRMRFECVCKRWQSIIQDDFYVDYQFSRSKATHTCSSFLHGDHVPPAKSACHPLGDHEVLEILSRLPVKSLMRFKCVCKHWESLIQQDQFFIDLHFSRSKATRSCSVLHVGNQYNPYERMRLFSGELFLPTEEDAGRVQLINARLWNIWKQPFTCGHRICTLDGLLCFMDLVNLSARVYNISTGESTPWIKTTIKPLRDLLQQGRDICLVNHAFGYDQATKEHKVLSLWNLSENGSYSAVCEVLTVRKNTWRRIDIPPVSPSYTDTVVSVYVNGSIYLLCPHGNAGTDTQTLLEFNVGTEKFRILEIMATYSYRGHLMELNGRLCILNYAAQDKTYKTIKMRTLYDHGEDLRDKKTMMTTNSSSSNTMSPSSAAGTSSNYCWVEETFSLPHYPWLRSIRHIPGTNLFIIGSPMTTSHYHYIWNKKTHAIILDSIQNSSALRGERDNYFHGFDTFTPNLLRVN
ncbi:hypothetical protein MKW92_048895 [Papaver armeniacum]|nr:hypothetical protein MKW92_048895 [Papaver armeniacum]